MTAPPFRKAVLLACLLLVMFARAAQGQSLSEAPPEKAAEPLPLSLPIEPLDIPNDVITVDAVGINAFQTAQVGSQVSGIITKFYFEEGDLVSEGQVVLEIDPARYQLNVQRADEKLRGLEVAWKRLEEDVKIKTELFDLDAVSRQDLIKIKTEAEIMKYRVGEARKELELARLDLQSCKVRAPFTGYLAVRFKQPDEPTERLEKIFLIVDSSKVYAVANVPESLLVHFPKGTEALYVSSPTARFKGTVERIGKLIDPKSRTKRIYLLIDNAEARLEVGMTGSLHLQK
jgi:RND family efflux transporter MFP subunit